MEGKCYLEYSYLYNEGINSEGKYFLKRIADIDICNFIPPFRSYLYNKYFIKKNRQMSYLLEELYYSEFKKLLIIKVDYSDEKTDTNIHGYIFAIKVYNTILRQEKSLIYNTVDEARTALLEYVKIKEIEENKLFENNKLRLLTKKRNGKKPNIIDSFKPKRNLNRVIYHYIKRIK